ncbi:MAG: hypothetical protein EP323_00305 [Gammaproteobacteria bacterium]|nr:MAG: hypothetical protein EP323_00305 [Gammaproteobacteria bacterium]
MIYSIVLPYDDGDMMSEKSVKAVMDEMRPYEQVDFRKMPDEEIDEYIAAWLSGVKRQHLEEWFIDLLCSDAFLTDTILSLWTDPVEFQQTVLRKARDAFLEPSSKNSMNPNGASIAQQLEENISAILERDAA